MKTVNKKLHNPSSAQPKWVLKSGVVVLGVSILSACQVMSEQSSSAQNATPQKTINFASIGEVQEKSAKQQLVLAMEQLLKNERRVTTEYIYQAQSTQASEQKADKNQTDKNLNASADSLFTTILKVFGYEESAADSDTDDPNQPFRTMAEFTPLDDSTPKLYLRYYDEVDGTLPVAGYNISRLDGMSERMQATDAVVYQLNKGYQACVQSFSYEVDGLVDANPTITTDDKAFKAALTILDNCTKEQDTIANRLRSKDISAYHRQDMAMGHICASNYRRSLTDVLSPKRTQKRYDKKDGSYDAYDSVYAQYGICHSVFMNGYRSDPVVYMNNGDTKLRLEGLKAARQCGIEFTDGVAALYGAGMGYRTHAREQQGLVYAHLDCLMDSAKKLYNEDGEYTAELDSYETPSTRNELAEGLKLYQKIASGERSADYADEKRTGVVSGFFEKYFSMKKAELAKKADNAETPPKLNGLDNSVYGRMAGEVIKSVVQTPQQVAASNYYAYANTKITVLSHHKPKDYRANVLMSVDFESPTATQSVQLPFSQDYKHAKLAVDANALLPVMAVLAPQYAPLAKDFKGDVGVMNFAMPAELQEIIPLSLVYDSAIKGFVGGLTNLHDSHFSTVDIRQDSFAKKQGAVRAVKVNMGLQQTGELLAYVSKQVIKDLSDYVEKNPQLYAVKSTTNLGVADSLAIQKSNEHKQKIKNAIEKWALLDKGFVSSDVGGLMQVLDGVLPIDYHQSNYYYFNANGQLVGQLVRQDMDDNYSRVRTKVLAMTSFKPTDFSTHHLFKKMMPQVNSFSFDGNAWVKEQKQRADLKKEASEVRYNYDTTNGVLSDKK